MPWLCIIFLSCRILAATSLVLFGLHDSVGVRVQVMIRLAVESLSRTWFAQIVRATACVAHAEVCALWCLLVSKARPFLLGCASFKVFILLLSFDSSE